MTTIRLEAEFSAEQLLRAVADLAPPELDEFFARLLALRAERRAPRLDDAEGALLQEINQGLPPALRTEYEQLIARRRAGTLTPAELTRLQSLTDEVEALEARRAACLVELARLRRTDVSSLLKTLGIPAPEHG